MPLKIDDSTEAVLNVLIEHGNATTGFIVDQTGLSRQTVTKHLDRLYTAGAIEYLHQPTALWTLNHDPRENDD